MFMLLPLRMSVVEDRSCGPNFRVFGLDERASIGFNLRGAKIWLDEKLA
jgi:hypothetical protein